MAIQDRFWRLVLVFWSISAAALVFGLLSKPLLPALVPENSAPPTMVAQPGRSAPTRAGSVRPTAVRVRAKRDVVAHLSGRIVHASSATSTETATSKTGHASPASRSDSPPAAIALVDVPGPSSNPPIEAISPTQPETAVTLPIIEVAAKQFGDGISSAQKWMVDEAGITVYGLLDLGTNYNFNRPATGNNLYRVFDYFGASGFEPNQAELYFSRSMPNQPGFVVDLNFLNTAEVMHGLTSYYGDQQGSHNPTGWMDPTQVYLTYTAPVGKGLNLSAGRQVSLIGFEYIPSWNNINFNQSIDLLYSLGEPFTVTGLRGTYPFSEYLSATIGINNGWDTIATRNLFRPSKRSFH